MWHSLLIKGGIGDDYILSDEEDIAGNDKVYGQEGDDYIKTGDGDDYIDGGEGTDTIIGGKGSDTYAFGIGYGTDRIVESGDLSIDIIELQFGN